MRLLALLFFLNLVLNAEFFDPASHKNWKLLQSRKCGNLLEDRIVGGTPAAMGAYPWMARIAYKSSLAKGVVFKCGGVLANEMTVITAAHCLEKKGIYQIVAFVRLGEHDTRSEIDCWKDTCVDAVQDVEPASIINHADYFRNTFENDIGIIRLSRKVIYSIYVKPICFLYGNLMTKNFAGEKAVVAGWGIKDPGTSETSPILLAVELPIVKNDFCQTAYQKITDITTRHLCVGGGKGKDSCGGDSGGPLMKREDFDGFSKYYLIGVVSFGPRNCGTENVPGVYTNVSSFMEWILDNLLKNAVKYHEM